MITNHTSLMEMSRNPANLMEQATVHPLDHLVFETNAPAPNGLDDVVAAVNNAISSVSKRKVEQTDLRTTVMGDGSSYVLLGVRFYDGTTLTHDGSGMNADSALKEAYVGILQQMGCYEDGNHAMHFPTTIESGWGHGV